MKIIKLNNNLKKLIAEEGYLLKSKNDNGETLEDGTFIEPYKTNEVYLGVQVQTLEQAEEIYEEMEE